MKSTLRNFVPALLALTLASSFAILTPPDANAGLFGGGTSIATAKAMIRELVYGYSQNCQKSYSRCVQFIINNDYPNYINSSKAHVCAKSQPPYTATALVDLNSVAPDKNWTLQPPVNQDENEKLFGVRLKGDTFIATVTFSTTNGYGITTPEQDDLHFTILNKKAYFFFEVCQQ